MYNPIIIGGTPLRYVPTMLYSVTYIHDGLSIYYRKIKSITSFCIMNPSIINFVTSWLLPAVEHCFDNPAIPDH